MVEKIKQALISEFEEAIRLEVLRAELDSKIHTTLWASELLFDRSPYFYKTNNHRRSVPSKKVPARRGNKFENLYDANNRIIGAYGYIPNWEEPNQSIFFQIENAFRIIYEYDATEELSRIDIQSFENDVLKIQGTLNKSKEYNIDLFIYDANGFLEEIISEYGFDLFKSLAQNNPNSKTTIRRLTDNEIEIYTDSVPPKKEILKYKGVAPYILYPYFSPFKSDGASIENL
jgi:hypothetical protein